jgi:hypothetical protein
MKLVKYLKVKENLDVLNYIAYSRDFPGRVPRPLMNKPSDVRSSAYLPYKQIALEESRKDLRPKTSILIPEIIAMINSLNITL